MYYMNNNIKGEERLGAFIQGFYWLLIIEVNCS